jgi:hypothetical protein
MGSERGERLTRMGSKSNYILLLARDVSYEGCKMVDSILSRDDFREWCWRYTERGYI